MTIHQLQSFLAVAEKQSFTAAADTLYISQSALSQQIRQLEHQLGFQLFDRSTRQVTLTRQAAAFTATPSSCRHCTLMRFLRGSSCSS